MIIYVDMAGDLFHPGHISFFCKIIKLYPDRILYVGLMADDEAEKYKRKPIFNINERVCCIESCKYVNKVFPNAPMPVTKDFIKNNNIDLVIHGDDIKEDSRKYWYKIPIQLKIYKEVEYSNSISTSDIIKRIKNG
jgi:cytidyltransferase-like protein